MNHIEIDDTVHRVLGDPSRARLRVSLVGSAVYPNTATVYINEDDQGILVRFTDYPALAEAVGVKPSAIRTKIVTTHEWSEAEHTVRPHYDVEMIISGVACTDAG